MGSFNKKNKYVELLNGGDYIHPKFGWLRVVKVNADKMTFEIKHVSQKHLHYGWYGKVEYNFEYEVNGEFHQDLKKYTVTKVN